MTRVTMTHVLTTRRSPPRRDRSSAAATAAAVRHSRTARRWLNVAIAALGVALSAPLMLVIAALIKLTSRGPVFYTQTRVGIDRRNGRHSNGNARREIDYGGRPFTIYKFRTMAAGQDSDEVWAQPDDDRVTAIGRLLRKSRLDELPQLFNVLRGDMNVVGPRPEQPTIALQLRRAIEGYEGRHRVLPGITGLAQITLHYDRSLDDVRRKVGYDLQYIARRSAVEDLKIMLRTVPVMLFQRGAW